VSKLATGWEQVQIRDVFRIVGGGTPPTEKADFWHGEIPWISSADISEGGLIRPRRNVSVSAIEGSATNLVPANSVIVVTRVGLGKVGLAPFQLCFSQDCHALLFPPTLLVPQFVAAQMSYRVSEFRHVSRGTTISGVTKKQVEQSPFLVPPLAEQRRIVAEIEKQFTRLDAARKAIEIGAHRIERFRSAFLEQRFSECKRDTHMLGEIADVQGGIQKQPKRTPATNSYPFLRVANVLRGRLLLNEVHRIELFNGELERLRLQSGDLLIVEGNGSPAEIGRMAIWDGSIQDCVHQNHIIRARLRPGVLPEFIAAYWNSPSGAQAVRSVASSTSGLHTLSVSKVKAIRCPVVSPAKQRAAVSQIQQMTSIVDALGSSLTASDLRSRRIRRAILAKAFSGQLVQQDPNDEPASVLLERIRVNRPDASKNPVRRKRTAAQAELTLQS
jgi:type I restriction enzyme, S subunit